MEVASSSKTLVLSDSPEGGWWQSELNQRQASLLVCKVGQATNYLQYSVRQAYLPNNVALDPRRQRSVPPKELPGLLLEILHLCHFDIVTQPVLSSAMNGFHLDNRNINTFMRWQHKTEPTYTYSLTLSQLRCMYRL